MIKTRDREEGEAVTFSDEAAAILCVQDYYRAAADLDSRMLPQEWEDNDVLYDAPLLANMEDPTRARVSRYTVNNQANTMGDAVRDGLFAQKPPFFLRPRGKTTQAEVDAWTALISALLDRMNFRYWTGLGVDGMSLDGTCIWKAGWSVRKREVPVRKPKAAPATVNTPTGPTQVDTAESLDYTIEYRCITESYPWIETRMLGTTLFDPGWRTPNRPDLCGYAIDIDFPTWEDLEELRNEDCYDIPDAESLKDWLLHHRDQGAPGATTVETSLSREGSPVDHATERSTPTTANPLAQPILMIERWDAKRVMAVLCIDSRYIVIRNEEHHRNRIPHFTANWRSKKNTGWGIGNGKLVGADQRIEQGTINHALNLLAYQFNPAILHARGQNAPSGSRTIRAGGFFAVDPLGNDVRNAMAVMEMPKVPAEAWEMVQYAKTSSQESSGADATFMQGQLQQKGSSAARTATGAGRIAAKADGRVQTPVENIELGLFNPFIEWLIDSIKIHMPTSEIKDILDDKLEAALLKELDMGKFIDASFEVEMTAAAKLAAKTAMAQQLPFLMQIFQQPQLLEQLHAEGKTISLDVLLDVLFAVSEYRIEDEIIVPLTAEEKATMLQVNAPNAKIQEATAVEQLRGENALNLEDRKAQNNLATTVAEKALERQGEGIPLAHAMALDERAQDEQYFRGQGPSPIAGA
jgi:hypothetical protein